jgi:hypothetical protein
MKSKCKNCEALQARIDALMLEFYPDEMTARQVATWGSNQVRVSPEVEAAVNRSLNKPLRKRKQP